VTAMAPPETVEGDLLALLEDARRAAGRGINPGRVPG
jgi:hypothetical protein